ncbi:hypothetical protein CLOM_g17754 [Closterium sp. NIES-68]|nr:hypothetical protein CLOM_g17754 [Closterium sp. NIES-68]
MHCALYGHDVVIPPLLPLTPPIPPDVRNRSTPVLVLLGPPASPFHAKGILNGGLSRRLLGEGMGTRLGGGGNGDRGGLWKEAEADDAVAAGESISEAPKKYTRRSSGEGMGTRGGGGGNGDRGGLWKEAEADDAVAAAGGATGEAVGEAGGWRGNVTRVGSVEGRRGAKEGQGMGAAGMGAAGMGAAGNLMGESGMAGSGMGAAGMGGAGSGFDRETVRGAFMEMVGVSNPKGWAMLQLTPDAAREAMQDAVFCVCLPDASHWLEIVCMAQAVLNGCIPVTFFHHYQHPWLHSLPFSAFSLNIDPMDVHETAMRLDVMLVDMSLLWRMQTELHSVQQRLLYNESAPISAVDQVFTALQNKASMIVYGQPLWNTE